MEILEIKNTPHYLLMPTNIVATIRELAEKVTLEEISRLRRECRMKVVDEVVEFCKRVWNFFFFSLKFLSNMEVFLSLFFFLTPTFLFSHRKQ